MMYFFAIKRDLLRIELWKRRLHPRNKTALDSFWMDACKHATKGIMGWNTRRKSQKGQKPRFLCVRDDLNLCNGVCATDGAANRHDEDFNEHMTFIMVFAIIRDSTEVCDHETLGDDYRDALYELYPGSSVNADLSVFFFLRGFHNLRIGGTVGLIATNTIAQGDTRQTGLDVILEKGGTIYNASVDRLWPGQAAVVINVVHIAKQLSEMVATLDGVSVDYVSSYLGSRKTLGDPYPLLANRGRSFQGSVVVGMGFVLTPEEAQRLIERDLSRAISHRARESQART